MLPGFVLRLCHQLLYQHLRPSLVRLVLPADLLHDNVLSGLWLQFVRPRERRPRPAGAADDGSGGAQAVTSRQIRLRSDGHGTARWGEREILAPTLFS